MKSLTKRTSDKLNMMVLWLKANYYKAVMMMYTLFCPISVASAGGTGTGTGTGTGSSAEDKWDAVIGFITPWITRLGGVVILIGAIEFGLAWKNDDAEKKTQGMRTVIAGCIVFAVGCSTDIFLA